MSQSQNDFVVTIATPNGSGSQSSNNILVRSLFRLGLPVGGKNLFPSNIQGLPTWFTIRVNSKGYTARKKFSDVVIAMNPASALADFKLIRPDGLVILNSEMKLSPESIPANLRIIQIPFKAIVESVTDSVKLKKLMINMVYVGVLAELLKIPQEIIDQVVDQQFQDKKSVVELNLKAIVAGRNYARENLQDVDLHYSVPPATDANQDKILIDGNMASAIGLVFGGATVAAWYPITPSSSVVENFIELAEKYRVDKDGKRDFAVIQAEDELSSIAMVVGAGWAGARAFTATSGPGISLMAEAAGLSYYAEIPAVIWDVQRVGPSTGLPTRTMQGDVHSAYYLSHGDTKHVLLLPGNPEECFEFGQVSLDLAERLQTLVIVLSDLDLGMNLHIAPRFAYPKRAMDRGKVLTAADLERLGEFRRYADVDGDGIPYRTLPGTDHPQAAYFTRGTGHDEAGLYSESADVYKANVDRLARKHKTAATLVPMPIVKKTAGAKVGIIYYGSSWESVHEACDTLKTKGIATSCIRLRALPFSPEFTTFVSEHEQLYVVEQNRDAQLMSILRAELPEHWSKCHSVLHYDGLPMDAESLVSQITYKEGSRK